MTFPYPVPNESDGRYGKQWVDYFLKDDNRSVEDIQAEIAGYLQGSSSMAADRLAPW
jgi:hypothetical protein